MDQFPVVVDGYKTLTKNYKEPLEEVSLEYTYIGDQLWNKYKSKSPFIEISYYLCQANIQRKINKIRLEKSSATKLQIISNQQP